MVSKPVISLIGLAIIQTLAFFYVHFSTPSIPICFPIVKEPNFGEETLFQKNATLLNFISNDIGSSVFVLNSFSNPSRRRRMFLILSSLGINPRFVQSFSKKELNNNNTNKEPPFSSTSSDYYQKPPVRREHDDGLYFHDFHLKLSLDILDDLQRKSISQKSDDWISHLLLFKEICDQTKQHINEKPSPMIILDDYIDISSDFPVVIENLLGNSKLSNWNIIKLGNCYQNQKQQAPGNPDISPNLYFSKGLNCMHGFVLKPEYSCSLFRLMVSKKEDEINSYFIMPSIAIQDYRSFPSDSGNITRESLSNSASQRLFSIMNFANRGDIHGMVLK